MLSRLLSGLGPADYEPLPRYQHTSGRVGSKVVVQGGVTKDFSKESKQHLSSVVDIFDPYSESWEQRQVEGNTPSPETYGGASASLHNNLFSFGGRDERRNCVNTVHKLDTKTWFWSQVSPQNADGAPMPKSGCGMIAFRNSLVVFGGYGRPQGPTEPQSFIKYTRLTDGRGWTNEFHIYNLSEGKKNLRAIFHNLINLKHHLKTLLSHWYSLTVSSVSTAGVWSCPATTGDRPPPCIGLTFTAVDDRRAVVFGGYNEEQGHMNDVYIIDLSTMVHVIVLMCSCVVIMGNQTVIMST